MAASEVQGPVIADTASSAVLIQKPPMPVAVTTSTTEAYIHACALSNQKASRNDPLSILFQCEKLPMIPGEESYQDDRGVIRPTSNAVRQRSSMLSCDQIEAMIYEAAVRRTKLYVAAGGFVVEAGNFAATTVWEPAFAPSQIGSRSSVKASLKHRENCPIFNSFLDQIEQLKQKYLYPVIWTAQNAGKTFKAMDEWTEKVLSTVHEQDRPLMYWHLTLTSRNPAVQPSVPGAVRAVIEPFVKKWVDDAGMPAVWLEAGSPHARDIYGYFGFRVVGEVIVGQDGDGNGCVSTWCMIYTKADI